MPHTKRLMFVGHDIEQSLSYITHKIHKHGLNSVPLYFIVMIFFKYTFGIFHQFLEFPD